MTKNFRTLKGALRAYSALAVKHLQLRRDYERLLKNFTVAQEENNRIHKRDSTP